MIFAVLHRKGTGEYSILPVINYQENVIISPPF